LAGFLVLRADVLTVNLEPFREPLLDTALSDFAFKWIDLATVDGRLTDFFVGLDFPFDFIAMGPATYTDNTS
jgi:hypothetical protein